MRILLPIALVVLAGCGSAAPSPTISVRPTDQPIRTVAPTASPSASPRSSPSQVTRPPQPGVSDLAVEMQRIESGLATHVDVFTSLGDQIVWSGGATDTANNVYRFVPGAAQPELVYVNPDADSELEMIRGSAAGYVFTDVRPDGGWRLLYLPRAGAEPIQLDESTDDRLPAPTIAMDDSWIAWEVVHGTVNDHRNELYAAPVDDPLHPLRLRSFEGRAAYMAFPALWGDELWYGIADNDWVTDTEEPRIELIDLTQPGRAPSVLGADARAFMPAPGREVVAWKSGGTPDLAALNAGTLTLYWRASGQIEQLPVPGPEVLAERISYPSVGNRFVAWWDDVRTRLYVYDLAERQFRRIEEYDLDSGELAVRPSLAGDLLVYQHFRAEGEHSLEWALLPN